MIDENQVESDQNNVELVENNVDVFGDYAGEFEGDATVSVDTEVESDKDESEETETKVDEPETKSEEKPAVELESKTTSNEDWQKRYYDTHNYATQTAQRLHDLEAQAAKQHGLFSRLVKAVELDDVSDDLLQEALVSVPQKVDTSQQVAPTVPTIQTNEVMGQSIDDAIALVGAEKFDSIVLAPDGPFANLMKSKEGPIISARIAKSSSPGLVAYQLGQQYQESLSKNSGDVKQVNTISPEKAAESGKQEIQQQDNGNQDALIDQITAKVLSALSGDSQLPNLPKGLGGLPSGVGKTSADAWEGTPFGDYAGGII